MKSGALQASALSFEWLHPVCLCFCGGEHCRCSSCFCAIGSGASSGVVWVGSGLFPLHRKGMSVESQNLYIKLFGFFFPIVMMRMLCLGLCVCPSAILTMSDPAGS